MNKFELPGSKYHYIPPRLFIIKHMRLYIEPNIVDNSIHCVEHLTLTSIVDKLEKIILDACELDIKRVINCKGFKIIDDKVIIYTEPLSKGKEITLEIEYTAKPRKGIYFIKPDEYYKDKKIQVWTQGESTDSRYWFVTFDHPIMRFTSEIIVSVPKQFIAISNGRLLEVKEDKDKKIYHWFEEHPHPAYLVSLVIGEFTEIKEDYNGIGLYYYIPKGRERDWERSFKNTKDMLEFFEDYLQIKYPYDKYAQVVVEDFIYGGMENISATTLTQDTLHDEKASIDFTSDHLVAHELAHQWFGDLVTCRDWQHLWLNEAFATYFDALYWRKSRGEEEFNYYMLQLAEEYFEEYEKRYKRAIVTNFYKYVDDLFDKHTYEKGAWVLHMLNKMVGEDNFRAAITMYLSKYRSSETDDFRRCIEEYGFSLQQFFDQWLRKSGHPRLRVEIKHDDTNLKIIVTQLQEDNLFNFPLDIKVVTENEVFNYSINIDSKENILALPFKYDTIKYISIDPDNKILKQLELKLPKEILLTTLKEGNTIEKVYASRGLVEYSSNDVIKALKDAILSDTFWGVRAECAYTLAKIKTEEAYKALIECLGVKHPKVRRAVVKAIGDFRKVESIDKLVNILRNDESYFVQAEAALAIGKSKSKEALAILKEALNIRSFNEVIASNAILGIAESKEMLDTIIEYTQYGKHHKIREAATTALSKYLPEERAYERLIELLRDKWYRVRINAIKALEEGKVEKAIKELERVVELDVDNRVKRFAEEAIISIKESSKSLKEIEEMRMEVDKLKSISKELVQRLEILESRL